MYTWKEFFIMFTITVLEGGTRQFDMISFVKKFSLFTIQYGIPVYNETIYDKRQQIIVAF